MSESNMLVDIQPAKEEHCRGFQTFGSQFYIAIGLLFSEIQIKNLMHVCSALEVSWDI